jgi:hypothetical protein
VITSTNLMARHVPPLFAAAAAVTRAQRREITPSLMIFSPTECHSAGVGADRCYERDRLHRRPPVCTSIMHTFIN